MLKALLTLVSLLKKKAITPLGVVIQGENKQGGEVFIAFGVKINNNEAVKKIRQEVK